MFNKKADIVSENQKPYFIVMFIVIILGFIAVNFVKEDVEEVKNQPNTSTSTNQPTTSTNDISTSTNAFDNLQEKQTEKTITENSADLMNLGKFLSTSAPKKKLLFFHSSWSDYSSAMISDIVKFANNYSGEYSVVIIDVPGSVPTDSKSVHEIIEIISCKDTLIPAKYEIESVPAIVILSETNEVVKKQKGMLSFEEIENLLK